MPHISPHANRFATSKQPNTTVLFSNKQTTLLRAWNCQSHAAGNFIYAPFRNPSAMRDTYMSPSNLRISSFLLVLRSTLKKKALFFFSSTTLPESMSKKASQIHVCNIRKVSLCRLHRFKDSCIRKLHFPSARYATEKLYFHLCINVNSLLLYKTLIIVVKKT